MRKRELSLEIDLLFENGRRCFDDCSDAERDVLTALVIQGSKMQFEYISETECVDILPGKLADYLLTGAHDEKVGLLTTLCAGAKLYAKPEIDKLFEYRAELEERYNSSEPSETELMVIAHNRAVANDMNQQMRSAIC